MALINPVTCIPLDCREVDTFIKWVLPMVFCKCLSPLFLPLMWLFSALQSRSTCSEMGGNGGFYYKLSFKCSLLWFLLPLLKQVNYIFMKFFHFLKVLLLYNVTSECLAATLILLFLIPDHKGDEHTLNWHYWSSLGIVERRKLPLENEFEVILQNCP